MIFIENFTINIHIRIAYYNTMYMCMKNID